MRYGGTRWGAGGTHERRPDGLFAPWDELRIAEVRGHAGCVVEEEGAEARRASLRKLVIAGEEVCERELVGGTLHKRQLREVRGDHEALHMHVIGVGMHASLWRRRCACVRAGRHWAGILIVRIRAYTS